MINFQALFSRLRSNGTDQFTRPRNLTYINNLFSDSKEVWVSITDNEFELYRTTPQLSIVINRDAEMLANGRFVVRNQKGEELPNHPLINLLENPNPYQSRNEWLMDYQIQKNLYGNQFMYLNSGSLGGLPKTLVNLPSYGMKIVKTGRIYDQLSIDGIVKEYRLRNADGTDTPYTPDKVIHSRIINPNDPLMGLSPLHSLAMPISNIRGAYGYRNVIITKKGAIGMITSDQRDSEGGGGVPLKRDEREKIERQMTTKDQGIFDGQSHVIVSGSSLKWSPMTYPTKVLMLFEEIDADFRSIIDAYGHDENIYATDSNAKYQNMNEALKKVYDTRIIPQAESFTFNLSKRFGLIDQGLYIELDYSHLEVMKENEQSKAETIKMKADAISTLINSGYDLSTVQSLIQL